MRVFLLTFLMTVLIASSASAYCVMNKHDSVVNVRMVSGKVYILSVQSIYPGKLYCAHADLTEMAFRIDRMPDGVLQGMLEELSDDAYVTVEGEGDRASACVSDDDAKETALRCVTLEKSW